MQVHVASKHSRQRREGFRISWNVQHDSRQSWWHRARLHLLLRRSRILDQSTARPEGAVRQGKFE